MLLLRIRLIVCVKAEQTRAEDSIVLCVGCRTTLLLFFCLPLSLLLHIIF